MLHAIVEHNHPQLWAFRSHLGQTMESVLTDGNVKVGEVALHHPGFVADILPLFGLGDPLKSRAHTTISTAQHPHRVLAHHGLKPVRQIQHMRGFTCASELHVAHDQCGQRAALAGQDAPIVKFVPDVQDECPNRGEWQPNWTDPPRT